MEWATLLTILLPGGLLGVAAKAVLDERDKEPHIETRVVRDRKRPQEAYLTLIISNLRDMPLPIRGLRLTYPDNAKIYEHPIVWFPDAEPAWHVVDVLHLDHRLPPFLSGSTEWPKREISVMVRPVPDHVLKLEFEVQMSWRKLWRSEASRLVVVSISPS